MLCKWSEVDVLKLRREGNDISIAVNRDPLTADDHLFRPECQRNSRYLSTRSDFVVNVAAAVLVFIARKATSTSAGAANISSGCMAATRGVGNVPIQVTFKLQLKNDVVRTSRCQEEGFPVCYRDCVTRTQSLISSAALQAQPTAGSAQR